MKYILHIKIINKKDYIFRITATFLVILIFINIILLRMLIFMNLMQSSVYLLLLQFYLLIC